MENKVEFPFGSNFIINNDQGLEEEELEDRKRREEEIHNLLTHAMGNCSLTDDSSLNSSSHTAIQTANDAPTLTTDNTEKQYLESNVDDQLKILYEIRSREVKELDEQLQKITTELQKHQQISKTKLALLELENERKNISLQEAQNLLANKTEQIKELNQQSENMKYMVTCLEGNLAEINDEKEIMRQLNLSLEQQLHLMEKNGFPLMNKSSDREMRESLNNKIKQLEHALESALKQNEQKAKQHTELVRELKQTIQEKDDYIAEKGFLINKLTENFETAQTQCQDLIKTVHDLRQKQNVIDNAVKESIIQTTPIEVELRKLRAKKEMSEMCDSIRKSVTEEFQAQIGTLTMENKILNEKLFVQEKQLDDAVKRGEIISIIEEEKAVLQNKLYTLEEQLQYMTEESNIQQKYSSLVKQSQNADISLQTSFTPINIDEFQNIKKDNKRLSQKIEEAQLYIHEMETKLTLLHEEYSRLKVKAELEQERDILINELKEKALNFERIILEKQQNYIVNQNEKVSVGINTEQYDEAVNSLLKLKYDALLYQREADLQNAFKKEFDAKHENLVAKYKAQFSQLGSCKDCEKLKAEIIVINEERKQDRVAVLKLVDVWQYKFQGVDIVSDEKLNNIVSSIDQEYNGRFKTLAKMLQEQFLKNVKEQEFRFNQTNVHLRGRINDGINKILGTIHQGDIEVDRIKQLKTKPSRKSKYL